MINNYLSKNISKNTSLKLKYTSIITYVFSFLILAMLSLSLHGCAAVLMPAGVLATGSVVSDQRSFGVMVDDSLILTKIKSNFASQDVNDILMQISVTVLEGRVLLTGTVQKEESKEVAIKIVWGVVGVKEAIDDIVVGEKKSITVQSQDSLIANQIRAKYVMQKKFLSSNYSIDVNDHVVYILGISQNTEEADKSVQLASTVSGVKKVVSYVIDKDDPRRVAKK